MGAKADSRESNQILGETVPRRTERQVPTVELNLEQGNASQETDTTFIYSQSSLAWRIGQLDSDLRSQESDVLGVGPTPNREMSPSLSVYLSLGLEEVGESPGTEAWLGGRQPDHDDYGPPGSDTSRT